MNNRLFGERLAALRKEKGMTQAQLAEILNVSNKTISRWETAEGYPEITLLVPLAKALGVTVDELLAEEKAETGSTFSSSAYNSENVYKERKETKHRDIPVKWPKIIFNFSALSNFLHIIYFSIFTFILIDASKRYNYTDKPSNSGIGNQTGPQSGTGDFLMANEGRAWLIAMIAALIILFIFNIRVYKSDRLSKGVFTRNVVISTVMTSIVIFFGISFHTGTYKQYTSVGITVAKLFDLAQGNIINFDFIKIQSVIIAVSGIAACSIYIVLELSRIFTARKNRKQSDVDNEFEKSRISSEYIEFWRSLTIFNKISLICIFSDILIIIIGLILTMAAGYVFTATAVLVIISNVSKVGLIAGVTGLVLGLLDLYDRQSSGAAVMIVLNLIFMYILPMILFLSTMTIATKEVGLANIISNVNIV